MKPYYQRTLDDFPDDIIVRARQSTTPGGTYWYAVLNSPRNSRGYSMPDFSTCATTREEAIRKCADVIRKDALGIGKYAPHSCLLGYDLHWTLCKYWAFLQGEMTEAEYNSL